MAVFLSAFYNSLLIHLLLKKKHKNFQSRITEDDLRDVSEKTKNVSMGTLRKLFLGKYEKKGNFHENKLCSVVWYLSHGDDEVGSDPDNSQYWSNFMQLYADFVPEDERFNIYYFNLAEKDKESIDKKAIEAIDKVSLTFKKIERPDSQIEHVDDIVGNYYCYFMGRGTRHVLRVAARFTVNEETGKIDFVYNTRDNKYKTLSTEREGIFLQVLLEQIKPPNIPLFFLLSFQAKSLIFGHYISYDDFNNIPFSGIEIFYKQDQQKEENKTLKNKTLISYEDCESESEKDIFKFFMHESTQPLQMNINLNYINGIKDINKALENQASKEPNSEFSTMGGPSFIENRSKWSLYHLHPETGYLAKAVLIFQKGKKVDIINTHEVNDSKYYSGSFFWNGDILVLNLADLNKTKSLQILIKIGRGAVDTAIGLWHNMDSSSSIVGGTLVIQRIAEHEKPVPKVFKDEVSFKKVPLNIRRYFRNKYQNFIKTPSKSIPSLSDLKSFINEDRILKDGRLYYRFDFFISSPIYAIKHEIFKELQKQIRELIQSHSEYEFFYSGANYKLDTNAEGVKVFEDKSIIKKIDESKIYMLIVKGVNSTGMYVELGYALKAGKPCVIFYDKKEHVPNILKNLEYYKSEFDIHLFNYSTFSEIPKILDSRMQEIVKPSYNEDSL